MNVTVSGKHVDIGDSLKNYVKDHLTHAIDKFFENPLDANAVLSKQGIFFRCDITVHVSRGLTIRCHAEGDDGYKTIDASVHKLNGQMSKYKKKLKNHHRNRDTMIESLEAQQYVLEAHTEEKDHDNPVIIAEMSAEIPTLSVSEAVMRMDLGDSPAVMFRNIKHGEFNIVYRRPDGNIGWIDPKQIERTA